MSKSKRFFANLWTNIKEAFGKEGKIAKTVKKNGVKVSLICTSILFVAALLLSFVPVNIVTEYELNLISINGNTQIEEEIELNFNADNTFTWTTQSGQLTEIKTYNYLIYKGYLVFNTTAPFATQKELEVYAKASTDLDEDFFKISAFGISAKEDIISGVTTYAEGNNNGHIAAAVIVYILLLTSAGWMVVQLLNKSGIKKAKEQLAKQENASKKEEKQEEKQEE